MTVKGKLHVIERKMGNSNSAGTINYSLIRYFWGT